MKYIHIPTFIISLGIGFFLVYIITPPSKVIYVYPNPDNIKDLQYKDDSDLCYKFNENEIKCPADSSKIRSYPIQSMGK
jgi:hypothetical protein